MEIIPGRPLTTWVENRIRDNRNCLIVLNGSTGSGKSYAAISFAKEIAEKLGTNFNISDNLDFKFTELLKKMSLPQNQKPGTPFIFEEVGAFGGGASAREWQSQANKFFFSFMQTSRHRNQIVIMNCPNFSFLERGARSLVHLQMQMFKINRGMKKSYARPYRVQVNSRTGNFYFKYLRVVYKGNRYKLKQWSFDMPPKEMVDQYEELKTKYTSLLNQSIIEADEKVEAPKKKKIDDLRLTELLEQGLSTKEIATRLGVTRQAVWSTKKRLKSLDL